MTTLSDVLAAHWPVEDASFFQCATAECDHNADTAAEWAAHVVEAVAAAGLAVIQLPEPDVTLDATEDEHGVKQWWIPAGVVAVFASGVLETAVSHYHGTDVERVRESAAALLAAAAAAEAVGA